MRELVYQTRSRGFKSILWSRQAGRQAGQEVRKAGEPVTLSPIMPIILHVRLELERALFLLPTICTQGREGGREGGGPCQHLWVGCVPSDGGGGLLRAPIVGWCLSQD